MKSRSIRSMFRFHSQHYGRQLYCNWITKAVHWQKSFDHSQTLCNDLFFHNITNLHCSIRQSLNHRLYLYHKQRFMNTLFWCLSTFITSSDTVYKQPLVFLGCYATYIGSKGCNSFHLIKKVNLFSLWSYSTWINLVV